MQDRTITLIDDSGKEVTATILFTYHDDKLNRNYVVFFRNDNNQASAAEYFDDGNGQGHLGDVQTEEEWEMLSDLLEEYVENQEDGEGNGCGGCCGGCGSGDGCGSQGCGPDCSCGDKTNK